MKMMIVMRTDLGMTLGKACAQAAHASVGLIRLHLGNEVSSLLKRKTLNLWSASGSKKVVVGVASLEDLCKIVAEAKQAHLETYMVTDAGKTHFTEPTTTCAAIGPAEEGTIDAVTGSLPLL